MFEDDDDEVSICETLDAVQPSTAVWISSCYNRCTASQQLLLYKCTRRRSTAHLMDYKDRACPLRTCFTSHLCHCRVLVSWCMCPSVLLHSVILFLSIEYSSNICSSRLLSTSSTAMTHLLIRLLQMPGQPGQLPHTHAHKWDYKDCPIQ